MTGGYEVVVRDRRAGRWRRRFALAVTCVAAGGCSSGAGGPTTPSASTTPAPVTSTAPSRPTDPIFSQTVVHEVRLVMDPNDWAALRQNFRSNTFYAANISLDGEVLQQVGVRSRGKGSRSGTKPGLNVDCNRFVPNQQFHGMKRLVLDNAVQDNTFLKEPLSYQVFEAVGIASPQIGYARLTVNDEYWGLYWITENISKDFLRARFGEDAGNLYHYDYLDDWRFTVRGNGTRADYVPVPFEPETNEDDNDASPIINFVQTVNSAPEAGFAAAIAPFIDVPRFLTYLATENAIAGSDGFAGHEGMNNFYIYKYANQTKFVLIPWDQDTTWVAPDWPILYNVETNVLTRKLMADPAQQRVYLTALRNAATVGLNPSTLVPRVDGYYNLMRTAALTDPNKPFTNEDFEAGVLGIRNTIGARQASILASVPAQ